VEVEPHRDRHRGCHRADPAQELTLAVVHVLGHHRPVEREEHRVAAAAHRAHDGLDHPLVGRLLDVPRGMRPARHRQHDLGARLLGHVEQAAELGIGVLELRDRGLALERPERRERGGHRGEGIGLVHHHREDELEAGHAGSILSPGR
jgi:hypothetical protein